MTNTRYFMYSDRDTDCVHCKNTYLNNGCGYCTECNEWGECDKCSNHKVASDSNNTECRCFEPATTAKTCPYYVEDK